MLAADLITESPDFGTWSRWPRATQRERAGLDLEAPAGSI
jgi:hypothetical protein